VVLSVDQRVARLEVLLAERDAQLAERDAQLAERDARIAALEAESSAKLEFALARIAELEAKLNRNSSNSSRPPSSDPPWANRTRTNRRKKGQRKRGAQEGHEGHQRALVPLEKVRHLFDLHPDHCHRCGSVDLIADGSEPVRHQVTDLPPIEPFTDEYRRHAGLCQACGAVTRASLPEGVPLSNFGAEITALVALLTAVYKVSKRGVQELFSDVFGIVMSLGAVINCERQVS
jgi:transposase